jgi:hypothetical protein
VLSLLCLEATIGYIAPDYRAPYPRLHDFAARACFTLTRNIRHNVFQERRHGYIYLHAEGSMFTLRTRRDSDSPNHDGLVFNRTSRAERLMLYASQELSGFPSEKFRRFSAATSWPVVFLASSFFSLLSFSFLRSREFQVGVCIDTPWTLASVRRGMDTIRTKCTTDSPCLEVPS